MILDLTPEFSVTLIPSQSRHPGLMLAYRGTGLERTTSLESRDPCHLDNRQDRKYQMRTISKLINQHYNHLHIPLICGLTWESLNSEPSTKLTSNTVGVGLGDHDFILHNQYLYDSRMSTLRTAYGGESIRELFVDRCHCSFSFCTCLQ